MNRISPFVITVFVFFYILSGRSQTITGNDKVEAGKYDMGKMWTFDYPPIEYFSQTYHFKPDAKWFENARLSALRFANYCSASFVSADGLVMTNHHCARESGTDVQLPGENFNENGFYAKSLAEERRVKGLYVDQLIKIEDVTERVQKAISSTKDQSEQMANRANEFAKIITEYKDKEGWKGLELQTVTFYSGGKYSLYGFKRYTDVRLVFMPEVTMGFFGGDYDNFTYPRYDLDCSFFRVYDENGKPLKTDHYFKFTKTPVQEDDPVFVIGNPGSTGRLWTLSDLEYRRDKYLPAVINFLKSRSAILKEFNKTAHSDEIINEIFGFENSIKALNGELQGLDDPYLMARKAAFETNFKNDIMAKPELAHYLTLWDEIEKSNNTLKNIFSDNFIFNPSSRIMGNAFSGMVLAAEYLTLKDTDSTLAKQISKRLARIEPNAYPELDEKYFAAFLSEVSQMLSPEDPFVNTILNGNTPENTAKKLWNDSKLKDKGNWEKLTTVDTVFLRRLNDPLFNVAKQVAERYIKVSGTYRTTNEYMTATRSELGKAVFELYGTQIPPDATFSLRISDGIVKGYSYNGTVAPAKTTFYGLYDRYYSFNKQYPWSLPQRWLNPPNDLLNIPMNFVATADIIGGNSGSPIINKNLEVVGLIFDGNIESLPGRFIYVPDANRSVSVDATGILGALKYIYKAKRLEKELSGK